MSHQYLIIYFVTEPTDDSATQEAKPIPPPPPPSQSVEAKTPPTSSLRRSSRKRTPSSSPTAATRRTRRAKGNIKNDPQALSENAVSQNLVNFRKRTPSASPTPATKKVKAEQKLDIKTSEVKKTPLAYPTPATKKLKAEQNVKTSELTDGKVVQTKKPSRKRTQAAAIKSAKLQLDSKTPETEGQMLSSKADRKETEKAQPKQRRVRQQKSNNAKERKPLAQRGRNKRGVGKKTKRNALRSPLPSFDDDDDDDFKLHETSKTGKINLYFNSCCIIFCGTCLSRKDTIGIIFRSSVRTDLQMAACTVCQSVC